MKCKARGLWVKNQSLQPGKNFEYTSGTPLATPSGFMVGSYQMINKAGASFSVSVPAFSLDSPYDLTLVS